MPYSNIEYRDMIFCYGVANGSGRGAVEEYGRRFPRRRLPNYQTILDVYRRSGETGMFAPVRQPGRPQQRPDAVVLNAFDVDPTLSLRRAATRLGVSHMAVHRTLQEDNRYPYHFNPVQPLLDRDRLARTEFCNWLINKVDDEPRFLRKILWTDEATFTRDVIFNYHNNHTWAHENPRAVHNRGHQYQFKIIYLLWPMIIFCSLVDSSAEGQRAHGEEKHRRQLSSDAEKPGRSKKIQPTVEKVSVPDDDDDKKTLAQQVIDGKYGLIQNELFSSPVKRPGIISYEVNPEVPKDNINNLGGLKPEEIWLAENHLLVLKGGGFSEKEESGKTVWPPIDNYIAPQRQVKIPPNPKIPPPFPIQLKDGGPIEVIKGKNNTKNYPPYFNGGPFGPPFLFPLTPNLPTGNTGDNTKQSQGNFTQGNGGSPFPFLPPGLGLYPPAIAFLPPPGNLTELDEDDPRIYYPPKYDFVYKKNYSSHVPPGPLVPGIILPPPPGFFAPLENNSRLQRPNENSKLTNSLKKTSKTRLSQINGLRQKNTSPHIHNYKIKYVQNSREQKIISPIHVVNNEHKPQQYNIKPNISSEEWVPIPAPRPFYITEINRLKALTNNKGNDHNLKYEGPKNGWDYENSTAMEVGMKIQDEFIRMNNFKNSDRESKKETQQSDGRNEKNLKPMVDPQYLTTERYENNMKMSVVPQYYTTETVTENYRSSALPQYYTTVLTENIKSSTPTPLYTTVRNENNLKPSILVQYQTTEKNTNKQRPTSHPQNVISNFAINSPSTLIDEENHNRPSKNQNTQVISGKLLNPLPIEPLYRPHEQYIFEKPHVEINTLIPHRVYGDVTIKTPSLNGRIVLPNIKYDDDYRNTVKPTSKPLSILYYEQESKYQSDDSGYSYDVPENPYRVEQYSAFPANQEQQRINTYTTTTKKPPIYEYSYSAPGYGTLESPKVGNNIETTPKPVIYESNFKPIKHPQFTFFEYQSSANQNDYKTKQSTVKPSHTTTQTPVSKKAKYVKDPYQTENPYSSYHTHDLGILDDITKKYFTLFGQKLNQDGTREVTTSLPKVNQPYYDKQYYKNYDNVAPGPTEAPNSNIKFPEIYNVQSDRPYYGNQEDYSAPKYRVQNKKPKPIPKQTDYSYYYSSSDPGYQDYKDYDQEVVRPQHPLDSDIAVNYKIPSPNINPDAELINPAYLNPVPLGGNSYISYRLPGNSGHFYFLTPQSIQQQNFPHRNSRLRYPRDLRRKLKT